METAADLKEENLRLTRAVEELTDEVDYLKSQLMDQEIQFPLSWRFSPYEERLVRHLLKCRLATNESLLAVTYSNRGGDEPELSVIKARIWRIRRVLAPLGVKIETRYGAGYLMTEEMKAKLLSFCEVPGKNGGSTS